jgi:hypothetical protein
MAMVTVTEFSEMREGVLVEPPLAGHSVDTEASGEGKTEPLVSGTRYVRVVATGGDVRMFFHPSASASDHDEIAVDGEEYIRAVPPGESYRISFREVI